MENFKEREEIKEAYRNLAAAAGVDFDEKDAEKYLKNLIKKCIDLAFAEAETKIGSLQTKVSLLNSDMALAKTAIAQGKNQGYKLQDSIAKLNKSEILEGIREEKESIKATFQQECREITKSYTSKLNPFHQATEDLLEQLSRYDVPKETWAEPIATLINSMGYLQWQANKKNKDDDENIGWKPMKAGRTL